MKISTFLFPKILGCLCSTDKKFGEVTVSEQGFLLGLWTVMCKTLTHCVGGASSSPIILAAKNPKPF